MKNFSGLATALVAIMLVMATPANADVFRFHFHGKFAEAAWDVSTPTRDTFASVQATKDELFADVFTVRFDTNGNLTGATDTFADVTGGYTFRIAKKYGSASVSGSGIPAQRCTYDANFDLIGCSDTTINLNVTWTATWTAHPQHVQRPLQG